MGYAPAQGRPTHPVIGLELAVDPVLQSDFGAVYFQARVADGNTELHLLNGSVGEWTTDELVLVNGDGLIPASMLTLAPASGWGGVLAIDRNSGANSPSIDSGQSLEYAGTNLLSIDRSDPGQATTLTIPDPGAATDTFVLLGATQTLAAKTLTTPTIASFTNAAHDHEAAAGGGILDHGLALTGLADDDHAQYALLAGRTGGQFLTGGTANGDVMRLIASTFFGEGLEVVDGRSLNNAYIGGLLRSAFASGGDKQGLFVGTISGTPGVHLTANTQFQLRIPGIGGFGIMSVQATTPGNGAAGSVEFNSSVADWDFRFISDDGSPLLFLDAGLDTGAGRVGVGTATPDTFFHVAGAAHIDGKLTVDGAIDPTSLTLSGGGTAHFIELADGSTAADSGASVGRIRYNNSTGDVQVSTQAGGYRRFVTAGSSAFTAGSILFVDSDGTVTQDNASLFFDDTNNRIGIGTASPDRLLEISGTGNQFLRVTSTDDSQAGIELFRPDNADTDWRILNDGGSLFFKSSSDDFTSTSPKMAIRVGGDALLDPTTVDISLLQIRVIRASNTAVQGMGIGFVHDTSNGNVGAAIVHERTGSTSQGMLHFATKSSTVAASDIPIRMTIDENGLVGIGTVGPAAKVEIEIGSTDAVTGLLIDQDDADQIAFQIDTEATTVNVIDILSPATTTGIVFDVNADELTTGKILDLTSNSATTNARVLVDIINDNTLATGAVPLRIQQDSTGDIFQAFDATTEVFTIADGGNVTSTGTVTASNLKSHALIEDRSPVESTSSTSFVTLQSASAVTFSGRPVLCFVNLVMFPSDASLTVELAVQIDSGSDVVVAQKLLDNTGGGHNTVSGAIIVTPAAGSRTLRIRWRLSAGTGTLTMDANDQVLLHAIEL